MPSSPGPATPPSWVAKSYFLTAFGWLIVFCLGLPWIGFSFGTDRFYTPTVIGWVHVLTIGVLTQIVIGAWYHLMIMITGSSSPGSRRILFHYVGLNLGLAWFLGSWLTAEITWNLTLAATVLAVVFTDIGVMSLLRLAAGNRGAIHKKFIGTGFLCFIGMGWLGFTMAHNKWLGFLGFSSFMEWIQTHALLGVGGWFGMMAIGISYTLIPFFLREKPILGRQPLVVFLCLLSGITAWITGIWTGSPVVRLGGHGIVLAGMGLWFYQMCRLWFRSAKSTPESSFYWIVFGMGYGLAGLLLLLGDPAVPRMLGGGLLIFMSVLCFEMGFLHRIIPFLKTIMDDPLKMKSEERPPSVNTSRGLRGLLTNLTHLGIFTAVTSLVGQVESTLMVAVACFSIGMISTSSILGWRLLS